MITSTIRIGAILIVDVAYLLLRKSAGLSWLPGMHRLICFQPDRVSDGRSMGDVELVHGEDCGVLLEQVFG